MSVRIGWAVVDNRAEIIKKCNYNVKRCNLDD